MLEAAGRMAILPRRIRLQCKGAKMAESLPRNFLFEAFVVPGSLGVPRRAILHFNARAPIDAKVPAAPPTMATNRRGSSSAQAGDLSAEFIDRAGDDAEVSGNRMLSVCGPLSPSAHFALNEVSQGCHDEPQKEKNDR